VTGSAHCALAPFWFEKFAQETGSMQAFQASPRGGLLEVALTEGRVSLIGRCVTTIKGKLLI
jgi:predicted PhzF superfamily epimerase YddE/YHI9